MWRVEKVEDEKTLLARGSGSVIRLKLIGLKIPKNQETPAKDYLTKTLETQWVRLKPVRDAQKDLKEGFVFISGEEVNARMIRMGLAEIDRDETAFDIWLVHRIRAGSKTGKAGHVESAGFGSKMTMKILIIGSGGREHTLAWKAAQSELVTEVIAAPGNVGIGREPKCRLANVSAENIPALKDLALSEKVDLVIVGPEAPLVAGITDTFREAGLRVFGPTARAAALEGSKVFTKRLMAKYSIPSADFEVFDSFDAVESYIKGITGPTVVKADGLAAGKGVFVCSDREEALSALSDYEG